MKEKNNIATVILNLVYDAFSNKPYKGILPNYILIIIWVDIKFSDNQ